MQTISLPLELVNQILGYLGTRPYQESYQLISLIQDAAKKQIETEAYGNQEANATSS